MRGNRIGFEVLFLAVSFAAAGAPLKFLTFNIWGDYFENPVEERAAGVEATILKGRPDVVALQEVTPSWYGSPLFANLAKAGYALVRGDEDAALARAAFCGEKTPKHINHEPILYRSDRLTLLDSGTEFFHLSLQTSKSVTWAVLECKSDGRRFAAFATHFWWQGNGEESDAIRELNARHVLYVLADVRRRWGADLPAILGGDLNSKEGSAAHAMLHSGGFVNAASNADVRSPHCSHHGNPKRGADGKYHGSPCPADADLPARSIDHVLYTRGIHALRHEIDTDQVALDVSDHSPVRVAFELVAACAAVSHRPAPEGIPGVVLVTADADGEPCFDCVGEAAPGRPMEPDTVFWMASNTKGVVAALVLNLASEGVLSLDDRVEKYFPSWKELAVTNRPTLRMLLCHTTGLDVFPKKPIARPGMDALAEHVHVEPLKFEPDTNYLYSNWDIDVAAAIVEKATGRPFDVEMAERIFKPLGMTDSTFIPNASQNARRATFYRLSDGKPPEAAKIVRHKLAPPYMEVGVYPEAGGGLLSTPRDMAKFFQMVARGGRTPDGRVLISAPLMAKWAVKQTPPCVKVGYSFGMKVDGKGSLFHGGVGGTWAEVNVKTRKLRLYMANFEGKCKAAAAFKDAWMKSSKLVP